MNSNPIVRALDQNGDWEFGASLNNYLSNSAALSQSIQTRISSFLGDCFFDLGAGINWFYYLGTPNTALALNLSISRVILNTTLILNGVAAPVVTGILEVSSNVNPDNRSFSVSYQIQTIFSTTGNTFIYNLGIA